MSEDLEALRRWRLVLGAAAEGRMAGLGAEDARVDAAMDWLYGRDEGAGPSPTREGGSGPSQLSTPDWLNEVHALFPKRTIERLERDAVEVYGLHDVVTDPRVLERVEPNPALLAAVLRTKHLMNPKVLESARRLVRKVVEQLMKAMAEEIRSRFSGAQVPNRSRRVPSGGPLDIVRTLRANLQHYDPERRRLYPHAIWFRERRQRRLQDWQIILLVDQSGSMLDSTIHAAVTAAVLHGLPGVRSHLVAFDTEVVDLTDAISDPVETLMKVQLGGGTDIARALRYGADLVRAPRRAIVVLVSDFYEGGSSVDLLRTVRELSQQGTKVLGLAALDRDANPCYDRELAGQMVARGAEVGAMTPGELAGWIAEKMGR